jgi:hypothetical protein
MREQRHYKTHLFSKTCKAPYVNTNKFQDGQFIFKTRNKKHLFIINHNNNMFNFERRFWQRIISPILRLKIVLISSNWLLIRHKKTYLDDS